MCLSNASTDSGLIRWKTGRDGKKYIMAYKVLQGYTSKNVISFESPFYKRSYEVGENISNRESSKLSPSDKKNKTVDAGIHVFFGKNKQHMLKKIRIVGIYTGLADGLVCIPVKCYQKDFVARGKFSFSFGNYRDISMSSGVFTKIEITKSGYDIATRDYLENIKG